MSQPLENGRTTRSIVQGMNAGLDQHYQRFAERFRPYIAERVREVTGLQLHDAEDLTQEVVIVFCQNKPLLDANKSIRGLLTTIIRNRHIDRLRRRTDAVTGAGGDAAAEQLAEAQARQPQEGDDSAARTRSDRLFKALDDVKAQVRNPDLFEAFVLTQLAGEDANEVAERLQLTLGGIHSSNTRIRAKLRELLKGEFPELLDE